MTEIKQEIINLYQDYKIFDSKVKKENEELKSREGVLNKFFSGEKIEEEAEKLEIFYKDSILKNNQLQVNFQQLLYLIKTYLKYSEDLPKEVLDFYKNFNYFDHKPLFILENEEVTVFDEDYLNSERKELDNHPLFKMIKEQAPN